MQQNIDYNALVEAQIQEFWNIEHLKKFNEEDLSRMKSAYELAFEAHKLQTRKGGGPYITHPIAVAHILAEEFQLGVNPIIAGFLHDVVEDTSYTIDDIRERFGDDVAFLVGTVTKEKKAEYEMSKQMDNYKQMLSSIHYDIRSLLVKLADRLHNMRTLSSMRPDKQMKIAGETDYFYAPLANRLGLYDVKTKLENLSMQFRCPQEYESIQKELESYKNEKKEELAMWCNLIKSHLHTYGINVEINIKYCSVYTIWKKMQQGNSDFKHVNNKYVIQIVFPDTSAKSEKDSSLKIYSALTDLCKEMPGSIRNYIDSPKENGYQAFHLKVLDPRGIWQKIQIASNRMIRNSRLGCISDQVEGVNDWIAKFREVLKDITYNSKEAGFMDGIVANFYNDDIFVFTPKGMGIILPKDATALDFAYEVHSSIGNRAQYARINGVISSIKTVLQRGDCIEIGTNENVRPKADWLNHTKTYKARRTIKSNLRNQQKELTLEEHYGFCTECHPLPGEEVIGFKNDDGSIVIHKRNCAEAIKLASQQGDKIIDIELKESLRLYPVTVKIVAIDRYHLLSDLVNIVTEDLKLSIDNLHTTTVDEIVNCTINFAVHSFRELESVIAHIERIKNIEEVRRAQ